MQLNRIDDPRDALSKARRHELLEFARANGVTEIQHDMPAILMRDILRKKQLTRITIPNRPLGSATQGHAIAPGEVSANGVEADATADLMRQYREQQNPAAAAPSTGAEKPLSEMGINELRKICQDSGIALGRTANKQSMRELIEAHRNGKNAS